MQTLDGATKVHQLKTPLGEATCLLTHDFQMATRSKAQFRNKYCSFAFPRDTATLQVSCKGYSLFKSYRIKATCSIPQCNFEGNKWTAIHCRKQPSSWDESKNRELRFWKLEQGKQVTHTTILLTVLGVQPHNYSMFPERTEGLGTRCGREGQATCYKYWEESPGF